MHLVTPGNLEISSSGDDKGCKQSTAKPHCVEEREVVAGEILAVAGVCIETPAPKRKMADSTFWLAKDGLTTKLSDSSDRTYAGESGVNSEDGAASVSEEFLGTIIDELLRATSSSMTELPLVDESGNDDQGDENGNNDSMENPCGSRRG